MDIFQNGGREAAPILWVASNVPMKAEKDIFPYLNFESCNLKRKYGICPWKWWWIYYYVFWMVEGLLSNLPPLYCDRWYISCHSVTTLSPGLPACTHSINCIFFAHLHTNRCHVPRDQLVVVLVWCNQFHILEQPTWNAWQHTFVRLWM